MILQNAKYVTTLTEFRVIAESRELKWLLTAPDADFPERGRDFRGTWVLCPCLTASRGSGSSSCLLSRGRWCVATVIDACMLRMAF